MARLFVSGATLDGLDLSGVDEHGVEWILRGLKGWLGSPASTLTVTRKAADHGGWPSSGPKLGSRTIEASGQIIAPTPDALSDAIDRLNVAASLAPARLEVSEAGRVRYVTVQRSDEVLVDDSLETSTPFSVQLVATDPRKYGAEVVASTRLPAASGGLSWPLQWPVTWTGTTNTGTIHVHNPGKIRSPVMVRIDGPITGPRVRHVNSGKELVLASSYALSAGSWLTLNTGLKTALENDQAPRSAFMIERGWFWLEPGDNDFIFGTAGAFSSDALLTITATPAWL